MQIIVRQFYQYIAAEAVTRLLRRGQSPEVAVSTAAFLLGLGMAMNIASVICLFGVRLPSQKSLFLVAGLSLTFSMDFLNRRLIKESLGDSIEELRSYARSNRRIGYWSPMYVVGSMLLLFVIAAIEGGVLDRF